MKTHHLVYAFLLLVALQSCYDEPKEGYEMHGIDVSHYQETIDWDLVSNQNIHFAFVKASEGESMKDDRFVDNWASLRETNLTPGAYHFFIPSLDATIQAENYIQSVKLDSGDLPPVLDLEVTNDMSSDEIVSGALIWVGLVEHHYGVRPIIYTSYNYYMQHLIGHFDDYPLWIARYEYSGNLTTDPDWSFWQYSDNGGLEGVDGYVDLNVFYGDSAALAALCIKPISLP